MKKCNILWVFIFLFMASCQSELDKYYEIPDWLKGSAYEVLEKEGNFTLFLSAVDKSDFRDLVKGKGQVTVMAPTDDAFRKYLQEKGYGSIDDINTTEINKLVGYHLVYYSFSKQNFMAYNPEGAEGDLYYPGYYYKFRTKSRDAINTIIDPAYNLERKIVHKERFLPVFSSNYFNIWGVNATSEYEQMYKNSTWKGDNGFNVSNAAVLEYDIVTDNGYLYYIDQVLEPLETIYGELEKSGYSKFVELYNRFATYEYDADATVYMLGESTTDSLFIHSHVGLPPIAMEWTTSSTNSSVGSSTSIPDYAQMEDLTSKAYSVFAVDDQSLEQFFAKYWSSYYTSLDEVKFTALIYLLMNHLDRDQMILPSEVPAVVNKLDKVDGNPASQMKLTQVCSNGILYGLDNNIFTPDIFESPMAPALRDPQFNMFMMMLDQSGYSSYFDHDLGQSFDVFLPADNMIARNTSFRGETFRYQEVNKNLAGAERVEISREGDASGFVPIESYQSREFVGYHIADNVISSRNVGGVEEKIYHTLNGFEYLYRVGDKIYTSATWNSEAEEVPVVEKFGSYPNGNAYILKGNSANNLSALTPEYNNFRSVAAADINSVPHYLYPFSLYYLNSMNIDFLMGERFIIFIPTEEAMLDDFAPDGTRYFLQDTNAYGKAMFINVRATGLTNYPFVGSMARQETTLTTFLTVGEEEVKKEVTVTLIDNGNELILRDRKGNEAKVLTYFPHIYEDGAVYFIDKVLDLLN